MGDRGLFWLVLLLLLGWLTLGSFFYDKLFCGVPAAAAAVTAAPAAAAVKYLGASYSAVDGSAFAAKTSDHFRFLTSDRNYVTPIGDRLESEVDKTAAYLAANPNKSLLITGEYGKDEKNDTPFSNLGEARANTLKGLFVSKNVPAKQIQLASKMVGANYFKDNHLLGGARYVISDIGDGKDARLERIKANLVGKPMRLYFATSARSVDLTTEQRTDFGDMIYYLDRVDGSKLTIGGHTDAEGETVSNESLSRGRARFVEAYLQKNGLSKNRMTATGYGETNPIGDNNTTAGRAKNRRVEIILK